jgi:hypothetical protein
MVMNMVECLVIFGAGASKGNGRCYPELPPLGSELLDSLHNFDPHLWPSLKSLGIPQESISQAPFEKLMDEKIKIGFNIVPYQKSLAIYFSRFTSTDENHCYNRLIRAIKGQLMDRRIILATLNYDLLLDKALSRELGQVNYGEIGRPPFLIKVHGSCNWLVEHHTLGIQGEFVHEIKGPEYGKFDFPPLFIFGEQSLIEKKIREDKIPPIMRIYASSKPSPTGTSWLIKEQNRLRAAIQESGRIIVIGARPNEYDDHIWGEIRRTQAAVAFVSPDAASSFFLKERDNTNDIWINARFEESWKTISKMAKNGWRK